MFNTIVGINPLTDEIAESFFEKRIFGARSYDTYVGSDYSLLTTTRALLTSKMQEDDAIYIYKENIEGYLSERSVSERYRFQEDRRKERISSISKRLSTLNFVVASDEGAFNSYNGVISEAGGFEEIEKVKLFFAKNFECRLFVNKEDRVSYFIMKSSKHKDTTLRFYHSAQCAILNAFPWFFNPDKGIGLLTERDMRLVKSLAEGNYQNYITCVREYAEEYNFRSEAINRILERFELELDMRKEQTYKDELYNVRQELSSLLERISSYTSRERDLMQMLEGIKSGILRKEDKHELRDMFNEYDMLRYIGSTGDNGILFAVDKYLDSWNDAAKDNAIHNRNSSLYGSLSTAAHDKAEKLFTAIFDEKIIKIRMTGLYRMQSDGRLRGCDSHGNDIPNDYMPNPHIYFYSCIGGYDGDIADALRRQDFGFAVEIAMASAGNINFEDGTVMSRWVPWLMNNADGRKCFELPDGKCVTTSEAVKWLEERSKDEQIN